MGKPSDDELNIALAEAARMREQSEDSHYVAKALLNLHYESKYLERVREASEHYLHSGKSAEYHRRLVAALAELKRAQKTSGEDPQFDLL